MAFYSGNGGVDIRTIYLHRWPVGNRRRLTPGLLLYSLNYVYHPRCTDKSYIFSQNYLYILIDYFYLFSIWIGPQKSNVLMHYFFECDSKDEKKINQGKQCTPIVKWPDAGPRASYCNHDVINRLTVILISNES